jgi:hypothetical protein
LLFFELAGFFAGFFFEADFLLAMFSPSRLFHLTGKGGPDSEVWHSFEPTQWLQFSDLLITMRTQAKRFSQPRAGLVNRYLHSSNERICLAGD